MLRPIIFAALLVCAFWLSHALIYEPIIVPALGAVVTVPFSWWLAALVPELLVCALVTRVLKSFAEGLAFCLAGGFAITAAQFGAGFSNEPGHSKIIEGGLLHFAVQFVIVSSLLAAVIAVVAMVRFGVQRVRAG